MTDILISYVHKWVTIQYKYKYFYFQLRSPFAVSGRTINKEFNTMIMDWLHWLEDDKIVWDNNKSKFNHTIDIVIPVLYFSIEPVF
jgi:hypothetical protein